MQKINILFVILQMEMGGAERLVHNVIDRLDRRIFNPSIAWFFNNKGALKEFKELKVPLFHVPKEKRFDFSTMCKFSGLIKEKNIHIVNAHHFMSFFYLYYGCKIRNNKKLIYTEHSEWEIEKLTLKWRILGSYLLSRTDKIVGVNDRVVQLIKKKFGLPDAKLVTIKNGVVIDPLRDKSKKNNLKKELGINKNEKIIGIVANFRKVKNHILLIKAFLKLLESNKNVKLLLIGQGFAYDDQNTEPEIRRFVKEKGIEKIVLFLGYRDDINELLSIMDIFCLVSFKEGLPISLIEAMAAGVPVIGTNVEGIRDVIIHNKNGFLVEIGDTEALKEVLYTLLTNESLRKEFSRESKLLATSTYSLDHSINQYQCLFKSIMKE